MVDVEAGRFTVGVFQDAAWAAKGIAALIDAGLPPASLTILAKDTPEAAALLEKTLGAAASRLDVAGVGPSVLHGPMVEALQGSLRDFAKLGLANAMRRVGFQAARRPHFRSPGRPRRHPGRGAQRAPRRRCAGGDVLVRRR